LDVDVLLQTTMKQASLFQIRPLPLDAAASVSA